MSTEGKQLTETIVAANDFRVAGALYKGVNGTGDFWAADDEYAIGPALSQPNSGQHLTVGLHGVFKMYVGAAVNSVGAQLMPAASGYLTVTASGDLGVGKALEVGASGDLIRCFLNFASRNIQGSI